MGLDMFVLITTEKPKDDFGFKVENYSKLQFWRKHTNLHGWMERLYKRKGGTETFNCVTLRLTQDDLSDLEHAIKKGELPHTEGFFFEKSDGSETCYDLAFIKKARKAIKEGYTVLYFSWW